MKWGLHGYILLVIQIIVFLEKLLGLNCFFVEKDIVKRSIISGVLSYLLFVI